MRLKRKSDSKLTSLTLWAIDAPGPATFGPSPGHRKADDSTAGGREIDAFIVRSEEALREFLARLAQQEGTVEMVCLRERLERIRELLGASPTSTEIDVTV